MLLALFNACLSVGVQAAEPEAVTEPVIKASAGDYRGVRQGAVDVFRGIPFAAPPVGALRWRPPQAAPRVTGIQDATRFGPICPQPVRKSYIGFLKGLEQNEDCLTLNIWKEAAPAAPRPVMVYIHGGGSTSGSGSFDLVDGTHLAQQGVVVVTFNYRLGVLGYFAHPALTRAASAEEPLASFGMMDQIAVLRWVKDNIAAFGGDPTRVTIFGMSAGGQSVNYLMAVPAARGLFHSAISESSALNMFQPYYLDRRGEGFPSLGSPEGGKASYEELGVRLAKFFGIDDGPEAAERLRNIPAASLMQYQEKGFGGLFEPVIDGRLFKQSVGVTFREGREAPVPYIAGATDWEGSLAAPFGGKFIATRMSSLGMTREDAVRLHGKIDDATLAQRLETDSFLGSQRWLVKRHARNGFPAWLYYFTYKLEAHRGEFPGAPHGAEVRFVFGTLEGLARVQDRPMGTKISPSDLQMAKTVRGYWVGLAKTGNPNGGSRPKWPAYTVAADRALELGTKVEAKTVIPARVRFVEKQIDGGGI
ncbi:carboxylesterase family protein [Novosphingobium sp.]|uniref:carboxylesterase/lipase family protein n=1 Tax=Novosphingobium sp. TaxID=1874826 RepID=UPI002626160D|nr:carboxylesterase family protein [Novosphingobium sp.]